MYEFAVIGNGMLGAPAARYLAQSGKKTLLIGAEEPADYTTHRGVYSSHYDEGRISRVIDPVPLRSELSWLSVHAHKELQRSTGIDFFVEKGHLAVGPTGGDGSDYIDSLAPANEKYRLGCERLAAQALRDKFPYFRPDKSFGGLLQTKLAGYINPKAYIKAENRVFKSHRGDRVSGLVLELREESRAVEIVVENETYRAEKVLLATGAFSRYGRLLPRHIDLTVGSHTVLLVEVDDEQTFDLQAMPPIIYKPLDAQKHCFILPPIVYPDGRSYLKIAQPAPQRMFDTVSDLQAWFKTDGDAHVRKQLIEMIAQLFPPLRTLSFRTLPCVTTYTPNGHPYIDQLSNRIIALIGGNAYVAKCSIALGKIAAAYAIDGSWVFDQIDREAFRLS